MGLGPSHFRLEVRTWSLQQQGRKDFRSDRYNNSKPRRDFTGQSESAAPQMVNTVFRDLVQQVLEKIKNESYFKWPNKMSGDPSRHNQSLYCQYHQERGHTTEDCRTLWNHLEQLVKEGRLQPLLCRPNGQGDQSRFGTQGNTSSKPSIGVINVIFAAPGRIGSQPFRVMFEAQLPAEHINSRPKRAKVEIQPALSFLDENKIETIQPHDDALVVTLRLRGYDIKRVLIDQGSGAEIMYPDLYKGLNLTDEDLMAYNSLSVSFEGKVVIPKRQIRLPMQAGSEVVEVDFIVVNAFSPCTAIVARP